MTFLFMEVFGWLFKQFWSSFAEMWTNKSSLELGEVPLYVNKGIFLGHNISEKGIEVDQAKVDAIEKMPCPKDIKGIRSFLGHAGFYRRFIK